MGVQWVEDPTNKNKVYMRNNIRATLEELNDPEISELVYNTQKNLRRHSDLIHEEIQKVKSSYVTFDQTHRFATVDASSGSWLQEDWLASRVLSDIAQWVSGSPVPPTTRSQFDLLKFLRLRRGSVDQGTVFGNCLLKNLPQDRAFQQGKKFIVALQPQPESQILPVLLRQGETKIWTDRFVLTMSIPNNSHPRASPRYIVRSMEDSDLAMLRHELYTGLVSSVDIRRILAMPSPARYGVPVIALAHGPPLALPSFGINVRPDKFTVTCRVLE